MATGTVGGKTVTSDSRGIVTSGPAGTVGLSTVSLAGYTPSSSGSSGSSGSSRGSSSGSSGGSSSGYSGGSSGGSSSGSSGSSGSSFQQTLSNGASWIPEAGGYVLGGRVVSTTPVYGGSSGGNSNVSPSNGYSTNVYMPGSTTPTQGQIINGATYVNGQRVPEGAVVQTAGGYYKMTSSGGVQVSGPPVAKNTTVYMPNSSSPVQGQIIDGATYVNGQRVPEGAVVKTDNGYYKMTASGGTPATNIRDWSTQSGFGTIGYDKTGSNGKGLVQIGDKQFTVGNIPGTVYDAASGQHIVTDATALKNALGYDRFTSGNQNQNFIQQNPLLPEDVKTKLPNQEQRTMTDQQIIDQVMQRLTGNTNSGTTSTSLSSSSPFQGVFENFLQWAAPYIQKPSTTTPTYDSLSTSISSQLEPLLNSQLDAMKRSKEASKKELAENLANRGVYNSSINDDELSKMLSNYGDQEATLRANFSKDVASLAQPLYQTATQRAQDAETTYNQRMISLGLALLNGTVDQAKFLSDDAYRNATLSRLMAQDVLNSFGTVQ